MKLILFSTVYFSASSEIRKQPECSTDCDTRQNFRKENKILIQMQLQTPKRKSQSQMSHSLTNRCQEQILFKQVYFMTWPVTTSFLSDGIITAVGLYHIHATDQMRFSEETAKRTKYYKVSTESATLG